MSEEQHEVDIPVMRPLPGFRDRAIAAHLGMKTWLDFDDDQIKIIEALQGIGIDLAEVRIDYDGRIYVDGVPFGNGENTDIAICVETETIGDYESVDVATLADIGRALLDERRLHEANGVPGRARERWAEVKRHGLEV